MPTNCTGKLIDSLIETVERAEKNPLPIAIDEPAKATGHPARRIYTQLGYNHEIDLDRKAG
jgi:hypothetical protein